MSQSGEEFANQIQHLAAGRAKSRSLRPLRQIFPFLKPYRWRIVVALVGLVISPAATLTLPVAGRGLIDHGFDAKAAALISRYFLAFIAVAAGMGVSGAPRFFFVSVVGGGVVAEV